MADSERVDQTDDAWRSIASVALILLAVLAITLGACTAWLKTQLLDTEAWADTSRATIQQPEVQTAVAAWTVDEVFARTDPADALASVLPERARRLAGPLVSRLRTEALNSLRRQWPIRASRRCGSTRIVGPTSASCAWSRAIHPSFVRLPQVCRLICGPCSSRLPSVLAWASALSRRSPTGSRLSSLSCQMRSHAG